MRPVRGINAARTHQDKLTPGVNFTNILQAAFTPADSKSGKKLLNLNVFFALSGSAGVKATRRTLMKLTPDLAIPCSASTKSCRRFSFPRHRSDFVSVYFPVFPVHHQNLFVWQNEATEVSREKLIKSSVDSNPINLLRPTVRIKDLGKLYLVTICNS